MTPEWSKILKSPPFCGPHKLSPSLEHLSAIYSERSALLWRPTAVQKWLKTTAQGIVEGMRKGKGSEMAQDAANWGCVREETFTTNYNEYVLYTEAFCVNSTVRRRFVLATKSLFLLKRIHGIVCASRSSPSTTQTCTMTALLYLGLSAH